MSKRPTCFWDEGVYASGKSTVVIFPKNSEYGAFLCGILNSEIMNDIYHTFFGSLSLAGGYLRFGPPQISALPIPKVDVKIVRAIAESVIELQKLYQESQNGENVKTITKMNTKINSLVAQAYGLS